MTIRPRHLAPIGIVFAICTALLIGLRAQLTALHIDTNVLMAANGFFFLLTVLSSVIQLKSIGHPNPNVFVRMVLSSMMLKMFATVLAVLGYTLWIGEQFNKRAIFLSLFVYLLYLTIEVSITFRLNKNKHA